MASVTGEDREGPLGWRQTEWFMHHPVEIYPTQFNTGLTSFGGRDLAVPEILDHFRTVVCRHEVLRTVVSSDAGRPGGWQRVASPAAVAAELESRVTVVDERHVAAAVEAARRPMRPAGEWPFRVVIAERNGRAREIMLAIDHSASDAWGLRLLRQDLERLFDGRAPRPADLRPVPQPLDLALWERSGDGAEQEALAEKFCVDQLTRLRDGVDFAGQPTTYADDAAGPRKYGTARLSSALLRRQVEELAQQLQVPMPVVCLVAYGEVLCRLGGSDTMGVLVLLANRWIRQMFRSVSYMCTTAPAVAAEVSRRGTRDLATDCARQLAAAQRAAHVDPLRRSEIWDALLPADKYGGVACSFFNWLNSSVTDQGVAADGPDEPAEEIEFGPITDEFGGMLMSLGAEARRSTLRLTLSWCADSRWGPVGADVLGEVAKSLTRMHDELG
jgi:hypothetical protein